MQHKYPSIKKLEVELKQLEEPITLPTRPCKYWFLINILYRYLHICIVHICIYTYIYDIVDLAIHFHFMNVISLWRDKTKKSIREKG